MGNREELERVGKELLSEVQTELCLAMPFLTPALGSLSFVMDNGVSTIGTDAETLRFHTSWLLAAWIEKPYLIDRTYMHLVLHCLFRHMFGLSEHENAELWNLSADISAESLLDEMDYEAVRRTPSDFREEWYEKLRREVKVLTAERLYHYFERNPPDYLLLVRLSREFQADDHSLWKKMRDRGSSGKDVPDDPGGADARNRELAEMKAAWEQTARRVQSEMAFSGRRASSGTGELERVLAFSNERRVRWGDLLVRLSVRREECHVDPDSFDYGFYHYGMQLYGNMPLIEENEFRESKRIRSLVIAVDTSASCDDALARRFLGEAASLLGRRGGYFERTRIHLIECDAAVRRDTVFHSEKELRRFAGLFRLHGGGGTDFRPVFACVDELRRKGGLPDFRGLIYFTDGLGRYPEKPAPYLTAFVIPEDSPGWTEKAPDWILKTVMPASAESARIWPDGA